jgi:5-hydroxyisourate hydrolase
MSLSTHVLDARTGRPAAGVAVRLDEQVEGQWRTAAEGRTDADGRIAALGDPGAGTHRLHFDTGAYFAAAGVEAFYPEVTVTFTLADPDAHHHVPLLLSPFAFSTYRGS